MTGAEPVRLNASFVAAPSGNLFCIARAPAGDAARGCVFLLPPFAEELNKSRHMMALAARHFAAAGWHVRMADLFGCGDSAGDFADATWDGWLEDLVQLATEARRSSGGVLWLWALRSGALFVPALLEHMPDAQVLLWQPVLSGRQMLTQFLRLKAAADMLGEAPRVGANQLRENLLQGGESIEVVGYALSAELARGLDRAAWGVPGTFEGRVVWIEVAQGEAAGPTPASEAQIERLRAAGIRVDASAVAGAAFWQTSEIAECPELIARSLAMLDAEPSVALP